MFFNAPPERPESKPPLTPILYSAVIFPGIGQFQQRRKGAGLLYVSAATVACILFVAMLAMHGPPALRATWDMWTSGSVDPSRMLDELKPITQSICFLFAVYLANVYDVWYAWYRTHRVWKQGLTTPPPLPPNA